MREIREATKRGKTGLHLFSEENDLEQFTTQEKAEEVIIYNWSFWYTYLKVRLKRINNITGHELETKQVNRLILGPNRGYRVNNF